MGGMRITRNESTEKYGYDSRIYWGPSFGRQAELTERDVLPLRKTVPNISTCILVVAFWGGRNAFSPSFS